MSQPIKNYYAILGIPENASLFEIESAYEKLAAKWHPDKHKEHRKSAEAKFHDINEAFEVLSDRNKRASYDQVLSRAYSLEDANSTFERFFNENGIVDENEEKFFGEHYANSTPNYYKVLGLKKNATLEEIQNAYRKLALKYHPKNNPGDEAAHAKFIQVNEAFNALSDDYRRKHYDDFLWGSIEPVRAHSIFDDFFGNRFFSLEPEDEIKPILHKKWSRELDNLMLDEGFEQNAKDGQTVKTSSVYTNKNGVESKKNVTTKKTIKNGKATEETTEEYVFPNGEKEITKTIKGEDGKVESKQYKLKAGEEPPKELTN